MKIYAYIILIIIFSCKETSIENLNYEIIDNNYVISKKNYNESRKTPSLYNKNINKNNKCNFDQLFNDEINENYKMLYLQDCDKPSGAEEVYLILKYLSNLKFYKYQIINDKILQILSSVNDDGSIEFLIKVINNEISELKFDDFSATLKYEIYKIIQDYNNNEFIGKSIADRIDNLNSIDYTNNLLNTYNPFMLFYLSKYADMRGDTDSSFYMIKSLTNISNNIVLNIILKAAEEKIITAENASEIAFDWADLNTETFDDQLCINIINSKNFSYKQKIIAASALATSKYPEKIIDFLSNSDEIQFYEYRNIYDNVLQYLNDTVNTSQAK